MGMKAGANDDLNAEINVTPLVDVMLVLLIIFMITAPMMNTGVDIELPQVTAKDLVKPGDKLVLSISIDRKLHLTGQGKPVAVTWAELKTKLPPIIEQRKAAKMPEADALYIEADAKLPYDVVVTAMAVVKDAKVEKVMMLTDPTDTLKLEDLDKPVAP